MFCPKCGSADQQSESYCRSCGEFLADYSNSSYLLSKILGGSAPSTQITVNLVLNLVTIFTAFLLLGFLNGHYDALENRTGERPPSVIYVVYAFLIAISAWQMLSLIVGARLRSKLGRKEAAPAARSVSAPNAFDSSRTQEFLPPADLQQTVPLSVTEDSTKILHTANLKKDQSRN